MTKENEVEIKDEDLKEDDFSEQELANDETDWKAKAQELKGIAKRRATQLSKAKAKLGENETELTVLRPLKEQKPPVKEPELKKPNEPDYAKLAFLKAEGVAHPEDQKLVKDEAERLSLPLTDVLQMAHIKTQLQTNREQREAEEGLPVGQGRTGGKGKDVDYYINNPDKIPPTQEMSEKVLDEKMKREKGDTFGPFSYAG